MRKPNDQRYQRVPLGAGTGGAPPAVGTPGGAGGPNGPGGQSQPCAGQSLLYPVSRQYTVEDPFGPRPDGKSFHDGIDIDPIPIGTPVMAAHSGTLDIHASRQGLNGGYGYFIILTGEAGSTLYGHLTPGSAVIPQARPIHVSLVAGPLLAALISSNICY